MNSADYMGLACSEGNTEALVQLLADGADLEVKLRDGRTALCTACYYGHVVSNTPKKLVDVSERVLVRVWSRLC